MFENNNDNNEVVDFNNLVNNQNDDLEKFEVGDIPDLDLENNLNQSNTNVFDSVPTYEEPAPVVDIPTYQEPTPVVDVPTYQEPTPVVEVPTYEESTPVVDIPTYESTESNVFGISDQDFNQQQDDKQNTEQDTNEEEPVEQEAPKYGAASNEPINLDNDENSGIKFIIFFFVLMLIVIILLPYISKIL